LLLVLSEGPMDNAISNDPELERKGCAAAAEYAQIHWAKLQRLVNDDAVPAASIELHGNDRRLYACFRASISEDVAIVRAEQLKTRIWRDLLTCMDGRVKDHNFMTLLRPDASLSYDDQRESLFVVPRAQFLMIELARQREGCYDGAWRAKRRACAMPASAPLRLARTARYSVLECAAAKVATSATAEGAAEEESDNARAARLGKQLAECVPCAEAARKLPWPRTAARRPRDGAPVVVDGALDQAACAEACAAALAFFDGAGDRRIAEQALHRGDDVAFVPLFGEDEGSPLRQALGPARRLLARAAADIGDADLLVPEVAQLAL
jgi:L-rhamnose mutarotase